MTHLLLHSHNSGEETLVNWAQVVYAQRLIDAEGSCLILAGGSRFADILKVRETLTDIFAMLENAHEPR